MALLKQTLAGEVPSLTAIVSQGNFLKFLKLVSCVGSVSHSREDPIRVVADDQGLHVRRVDPSHSSIIEVRLGTKAFQDYELSKSDKSHIIGLTPGVVADAARYFLSDSVVIGDDESRDSEKFLFLEYFSEANRMRLRDVVNPKGQTKLDLELGVESKVWRTFGLGDPAELKKVQELRKLKWSGAFYVGSRTQDSKDLLRALKHIVSERSGLGTLLEIKYSRSSASQGEVVVSSKSNYESIELCLAQESDKGLLTHEQVLDTKLDDPQNTVSTLFATKYFVKPIDTIAKLATNGMLFKVAQDRPMAVSAEFAPGSTVNFWLAPRIAEGD
jgi:hypothetical protein